jgi:hypothetical protein
MTSTLHAQQSSMNALLITAIERTGVMAESYAAVAQRHPELGIQLERAIVYFDSLDEGGARAPSERV